MARTAFELCILLPLIEAVSARIGCHADVPIDDAVCASSSNADGFNNVIIYETRFLVLDFINAI